MAAKIKGGKLTTIVVLTTNTVSRPYLGVYLEDGVTRLQGITPAQVAILQKVCKYYVGENTKQKISVHRAYCLLYKFVHKDKVFTHVASYLYHGKPYQYKIGVTNQVYKNIREIMFTIFKTVPHKRYTYISFGLAQKPFKAFLPF